nr:formate dehydrogenase subunit beta [Ottowia sp.]
FDVPRISTKDNKAYKCSLCADRVAVSQEPACAKACPTGAIRFGSKEDMLTYGESRVTELKTRGYEQASVYNPAGVGGTHVMYVLQHGDKPQLYANLPQNPTISATVAFWKGLAKPIALATMVGAAVVGFFHHMKQGPLEVPEEDEDYVPDGQPNVIGAESSKHQHAPDAQGDQP